MRVLLNMLVASGRKTGIGYYVSELLRCLTEASPEDHFESFPRPWIRSCYRWADKFRTLLGTKEAGTGNAKKEAMGRTRREAPKPSRLRVWMQSFLDAHLRRLARQNEYSLYHEPNYLPLPTDLPTVTTVHDLSILLHPEWHPVDRVLHFEKNFGRTLTQSAHLLAISESGRQEIIQEFGVPPEKVTRTYMGVRPGLRRLPHEDVARVLRELALPPRYLLFVGTIEPRKNVLMLMRAYCSLPAQFQARWPLLLVGRWGWNTHETREYFETEARHKGVLHLGYVSEHHLAALYNGARALVFPSHYEGFGLPPLEMLACGGSVLASTSSAVQEVLGGVGHVIPSQDFDGWRNGMQRVTEDDDWWASLQIGATERARNFTWEQCARDTLEAYRNTLSRSKETGRNRAA